MNKSGRPTFKECMRAELKPVLDKHFTDPAQRMQRRLQPGGNFGDDQLKAKKATPHVLLRLFVVFPIGAVGVALCVSIIGLPIGIPLLLWVGAYVSKPIRQLPAFNVNTKKKDEDDN
jgi:hypothetical protein